jgi:sugar lactone lactonase YvrE
MKRKIFLSLALVLLLSVMLFMAWDMFLNKPAETPNPHAYELDTLRVADTSQMLYSEVQHLDSRLASIHGIAVDPSDRIYLCGENGVEIYDHSGKFVSGFTFSGIANCIYADKAGSIFLGMQDHLEIFDATGRLLRTFTPSGNNAIITSIVAEGRDIFMADAGNKLVGRYDQSGNLVNKIGEKDPARDIPGFIIPSPYFDLCAARDGNLWVVNPGHHRLEKYTPEGDLLSAWGEASMTTEGFCGCCNPSHIALLSDGSFVTSEKGIERIKVYDGNGTYKCLVAGPDCFVEGTRGLDLAVDSKDRILVLDPEKKQVRIFALKGSLRN